MGRDIGVTLDIYEFSTPVDKQVLVQAYQQGQNQGLTNALSKMKAVRHLKITGTLWTDCSSHQDFCYAYRSQDHLCHRPPDPLCGGLRRQQLHVLQSNCRGPGVE